MGIHFGDIGRTSTSYGRPGKNSYWNVLAICAFLIFFFFFFGCKGGNTDNKHNKQTNKTKTKQNKQTNKHTNKKTNKQRNKQTNKPTQNKTKHNKTKQNQSGVWLEFIAFNIPGLCLIYRSFSGISLQSTVAFLILIIVRRPFCTVYG